MAKKKTETKNVEETVQVPTVQTSEDMIMGATQPGESNDVTTAAVSSSYANQDISKFVRPRKTRTIINKFNRKVGRNEPCPCGAVDENGKRKKFKNCCMGTGEFDGTRELTAQEMAQVRYGTKSPSKYKIHF